MIVLFILGRFFFTGTTGADTEMDVVVAPNENESDASDEAISVKEPEVSPEEPFTDVRISALGDIMFHDDQLESAYIAESDSYDFKSMFKDVKPILSTADLTLANFETTTAGSSRAYTGYPTFNSPDEVIDAIQYAGVDVLTTANNHSLDTGSDGLKRTLKILRKKGIDTVGTYGESTDSRILLKDVEGIKFAILSYTESTNGLGDQYPPEQLNSMINLMTEDNIKRDIQKAKELDVDFIITFMHWGVEYVEIPNDRQTEFAQMMAEEGVDLILGSHPHVIQKSDVIKTNDKETFVIYSMGNFISNQRKETLGDSHEFTEDGIIVNLDIRKNDETGETTIQNIEYVPTWVYRDKEDGQPTYTYRVLPIENFLFSDEISDEYKRRMERSLDETTSKMYENPF